MNFSRLFFDGGFRWGESWWQSLIRDATTWFLCVSLLAVVGVYACNRLLGWKAWDIDGRRVAYLFAVLILGAGLIVNVALKDNFGRARPRDIVEFGGSKVFTPAFVPSDQCRKNCSFSSGEGAAGFFALALALALSGKRRVFVAAMAIGALVSLARIAAGAHFLSDTVVSFFVMLVIADVLRHYMIPPGATRRPVPAPAYAQTGRLAEMPGAQAIKKSTSW
jgi:lipid A 4'-phosphatase